VTTACPLGIFKCGRSAFFVATRRNMSDKDSDPFF
jgi:hypothetical protein